MFWQFSLENISIATYLITFFFGILVCATPCVYPIIPVIVGYIGTAEIKSKREGFLRSLSYILGLALVYSTLGAIAALTGSLFGVFQSNFWTYFVVANIFIIMGLFMLDVFRMPQISFFNKMSFMNKSGMAGAFLVGAASGLVVGPCTTPVFGAILAYVAAKQNVFLGITLLFTYAFGMGLPLLLLGSFLGAVKKMPKAGPWMVRIKKIFGLILIASGEYFLLGSR